MCRPSKPVLWFAALAFFALVAAACADDADTADADTAPAGEPDPVPEDSSGSTVPPEASVPTETAERDFSAISPIVEEFVEGNELAGAGLVVVHGDDGVIHEEYWGEFDADRISLVASSTKMVTAGVLLHLHDQGLLDMDAPVADVVEWGSGNPDITPAQLVSNSSGLVGLADTGYPPYLCQFSPATTLQECGEAIFTTTDDDADVIPPDTEFRYGGAQWQVAGAVAEAASGQSWDELVTQIVVEPCGLETFAYNNPFLQLGVAGFGYPEAFAGDPATLMPVDNPNLEGGAYSTTGDYAQLLLMHLRGGMCGETQVLSADALARAHGDRVAAAYGDAADDNPGYGMGWWVDRETGRITDPGAYGTVPWLDLDDGYGAYLVIEATSVLGGELASLLYEPVEAAVLG